jgi:hypothetical protein
MAQIEYTAFRCIQMLSGRYGILKVIPEVGDDVLIEYKEYFELHQVKTRVETQGPWLANLVAPILAKQLLVARKLEKPTRCIFVSNAAADNSDSLANCYNFANFKKCGELLGRRLPLSYAQKRDYLRARHCWTDVIQGFVFTDVAPFSRREIIRALKVAEFQTSSSYLRNPIDIGSYCQQNLIFLDQAMGDAIEGCPSFSALDLSRMYSHLLALIVEVIATRKSGDSRQIGLEDVKEACLMGQSSGSGLPDLTAYDGRNLAEKKANLAGFDPTTFPLIAKQRKLALAALRELSETHHADDVDLLITEVLQEHEQQRDLVSKNHPGTLKIGKRIFKSFQERLEAVNYILVPRIGRLERSTYFGILWEEANKCHAWFHGTEGCSMP